MKKLLILVVSVLFVVSSSNSVAFAVKPTGNGKPSGGTSEMVGYDISYPQCGRSLPTDFYFGIVGVNGGNAAKPNPCLAEQLAWAATAKDGSTQSKQQVYVNTANPGEFISEIDTWPDNAFDANGILPDNPYGDTCRGENDLACSWLYGWNRSIYAESVFEESAGTAEVDVDMSKYVWWLDVETMNTWQAGSDEALRRNIATLEGMASYYQLKDAAVGLYSTAYQWGVITGNFVDSDSPLAGLPNWRPSGSSLKNAIANCSVDPLTPGGSIALTQYVQKNLDKNHSCDA